MATDGGRRPSFLARDITAGAIMAALSALLGLGYTFIPGLSVLIYFIWPIPTVVLVMRHDLRTALLSAVAAAVLMGLFIGPVQALVAFVTFAAIGLFFGDSFRRHRAPLLTLTVGCVIAAAVSVLAMTLSFSAAGLSLQSISTELGSSLDQLMQIYEEAGVLSRILPEGMTAAEYREQYLSLMQMLLPGALIITGMILSCGNYFLSGLILRRLKFSVPEMPRLDSLRFPWPITWGVILGIAGLLLERFFDLSLAGVIGRNLLYVFGFVALIGGISMMIYLWKHVFRFMGRFFIVFCLVALTPYAILTLVCIGVLDPLFDFRRILALQRELLQKSQRPYPWPEDEEEADAEGQGAEEDHTEEAVPGEEESPAAADEDKKRE